MQRVGGVGRDLRVAPGRVEPLRGDRRVVVAVDQVVRDARMVGLLQRRSARGSSAALSWFVYFLSVGSKFTERTSA